MAETNRKHRKLFSMLLTLALTVTMAFGTAVNAYASDKDIVILFTNDVHCGVDDNLGYAGLALYEKQVQEETPYVILADAGDAIQGAPIGTLSEGGYITDIMNQVGYDFAIPGNHEFDYGMERFLELAGSLDCGYYSCNFMNLQTKSRVFAPYKMFEFGGTLYQGNEENYRQICEEFHRMYGALSNHKEEWENLGEQLLMFFVYTYFCGAVYDDMVCSKMELALFSVRWIQEFLITRWLENGKQLSMQDVEQISCWYAREIEHSDDNLNALEDWLFETYAPEGCVLEEE